LSFGGNTKVPRHPDPDLEKRILDAASRFWARGGEKALTMRAVAKAAGTTTPTVYERYRDRDDILRALRLQTRRNLFAALSQTHTLREAIHRQIEFAMETQHAYEALFDNVAQPPSAYEPWPSFTLLRERLTQRLGGTPRSHTRLMLAIWSLMHGTAMLVIRGRFEGALQTQAVHSCLDAIDTLIDAAARPKGFPHSGPRWPVNLILGEGEKSRLVEGETPQIRSKATTVKKRH
jgi:AcrR family transcriptional regulator